MAGRRVRWEGQHDYASLTILTISSRDTGALPPMDFASLNSCLAAWYMAVAPAIPRRQTTFENRQVLGC
jgi:hypothetical protein